MSHETPNALLSLPTGADLDVPEDRVEALLSAMPTGKDLPYDDGEPMESPWHRDQMNLLIDSLKAHWHDRTDFFVGGNMFVYYSRDQAMNRDFRGPDFFVVLDVERDPSRVSWVAWAEGGRCPDVIVELLSPTTAVIDRGVKKDIYARSLRTSEYFLYDPDSGSLEGWRLDASGYITIAPAPDGRVRSNRLDLALGPWDGAYQATSARWLRFFTPVGALVPTFAEAFATHANAEADARAVAEAEVARLRQELDALRKQAPPSP